MMSVKIVPSFAKFLPLLFLKSSKNGAGEILSVPGVKAIWKYTTFSFTCNMFRDRAAYNLMSHPIPHVAGTPNTCPKINRGSSQMQSVTLQVSPSKESFSTPLLLSGPPNSSKRSRQIPAALSLLFLSLFRSLRGKLRGRF